jgi:hypothetical protein
LSGRYVRVQGEIMGSPKFRNIGESQSVLPYDQSHYLLPHPYVSDVSPPAPRHHECRCCGVVQFSTRRRRHHCRQCGRVVCGACSETKATLPARGQCGGTCTPQPPLRMRLTLCAASYPISVCTSRSRPARLCLHTYHLGRVLTAGCRCRVRRQTGAPLRYLRRALACTAPPRRRRRRRARAVSRRRRRRGGRGGAAAVATATGHGREAQAQAEAEGHQGPGSAGRRCIGGVVRVRGGRLDLHAARLRGGLPRRGRGRRRRRRLLGHGGGPEGLWAHSVAAPPGGGRGRLGLRPPQLPHWLLLRAADAAGTPPPHRGGSKRLVVESPWSQFAS